ncbi:hypothetical protein BDV93DRAFT_519353 [Ceratobasidium sp. AG-I]|nr:hypothetical protein BDV93DRAFT_519353 [Ceratobasidium sp. AG-I]
MERLPRIYEDMPPECLLRVIEFLTLADVTVLLRTSAFWHSIITQNENAIYCQLSNSQEPNNAPLGSLDIALTRWISPATKQVKNWKQYCQLQVNTKKRWLGKERGHVIRNAVETSYGFPGCLFVVDIVKALLAVTSRGLDETEEVEKHSLVVHCLQDPTRPTLFQLDVDSTATHVEMANGFVVFTHENIKTLEVWRWAEDQAADPLSCAPTDRQRAVYETAMNSAGHLIGSSPRRGELVPMGVLEHPSSLYQFRLAYPTLCVGSRVGDRLWLWDIRVREMIQTIDIRHGSYTRPKCSYVDVNDTHAFVAADHVSVYSRATGECVFLLRKLELFALALCVAPSIPSQTESIFEEYELQQYKNLDQLKYRYTPDDATGVRVSPSGDDFVVATTRGYVFHFSGLKGDRIMRGGFNWDKFDNERDLGASFAPRLEKLDLGGDEFFLENFRVSVAKVDERLDNLAYDGDRILTHGLRGLCFINLENQPGDAFQFLFKNTPFKLHPFPARKICRTHPFGSAEEWFLKYSSMQLTQEGFWVARDLSMAAGMRQGIGMIDFAQPAQGSQASEV